MKRILIAALAAVLLIPVLAGAQGITPSPEEVIVVGG